MQLKVWFGFDTNLSKIWLKNTPKYDGASRSVKANHDQLVLIQKNSLHISCNATLFIRSVGVYFQKGWAVPAINPEEICRILL